MSRFLGDGDIKLPPASYDRRKYWSLGFGALVVGGVTAALFVLQTQFWDKDEDLDPDSRKELEKNALDQRQEPDVPLTVMKPESPKESPPPIPVLPGANPPTPRGLDFRVERDNKGTPVAINLSWARGNNPQNLATEYRVYQYLNDDKPPIKPTDTVQKNFFPDTQMQWCKKLRYAVSAVGKSGAESEKEYLKNVVTVYQRLDPPKISSCKRRDSGNYYVKFASIPETQRCSFAAYRVERCTDLTATVPKYCAEKNWQEQRCSDRKSKTGARCTLFPEEGTMYRASVENKDEIFSDKKSFHLEGEGCI